MAAWGAMNTPLEMSRAGWAGRERWYFTGVPGLFHGPSPGSLPAHTEPEEDTTKAQAELREPDTTNKNENIF